MVLQYELYSFIFRCIIHWTSHLPCFPKIMLFFFHFYILFSQISIFSNNSKELATFASFRFLQWLSWRRNHPPSRGRLHRTTRRRNQSRLGKRRSVRGSFRGNKGKLFQAIDAHRGERGSPHVPSQKTSKNFGIIAIKVKNTNRGPPYIFSQTPSTPLKRIWKRLCIYLQANIIWGFRCFALIESFFLYSSQIVT